MDYFERIEEYLNNTLSENDKQAFEEEMGKDAKLKQAVEDHEAAMDVVGSILEGEVRKVIGEEELKIGDGAVEVEDDVEDKGKMETGKKGIENVAKVKRMNWMRWAAAASLVFVLGWWGMNQFSENNNSQLYASMYSDPTWPLERGQDSSDLNASIVKYFNTSKEEAKTELKSYSTPEARYWLSEVYFKEMKFDSTLLYLPKVSNDIDNERRDRINYLKILSLYFDGDKVAAKEANSTLPSDTDVYYNQIYSKLSF